MKRFCTTFLLTFLIVLLSGIACAAELKSISVGENNELGKIVITADEPLNYVHFTLDNPSRYVLDFKNIRVRAKPPTIQTPTIQSIRHGFPNPETYRLVIDVNTPLQVLDSGWTIENNTQTLTIRYKPTASVTAVTAADPATTPLQPATDNSQNKTEEPAYKGGSFLGLPAFKRPEFKPYDRSVLTKTPEETRRIKSLIPQPKPIEASKAAGKAQSWGYKPIIVLDAGHGGKDPGARSTHGFDEKIVTLAYAKAIRDALLETTKYRVVMTRNRDEFVGLKERVQYARKAKGDIFISIHADAHEDSSMRGLSVYTLSEARAKFEVNRLTARAENQEVLRGVDLKDDSPDVKKMLIGMAQRDTKNISAAFAEILVKQLGKETNLLRNTHRHKGLQVLTGADIPSVLVELGYLSNAQDSAQLTNERARQQRAQAFVRAIDAYFYGKGNH